MRFLALFFVGVLLSGAAHACEIGDPFPFSSEDECSANAQKLMERISGCLHFAGEDATGKKRAAEITKATKELRCDYLLCDYAAMGKADHDMVKLYIERTFTDEDEFKGTFRGKSCKVPTKPKAKTTVKKPVVKPVAKPVVKSTAKQPVKTTGGKSVTTKSTTSPKPVKPQ